MYSSVSHIHFLGIGGIGMSGIAEILLSQGFTVSGSDAARSETTDYLASLGARVFIGHAAEHIAGADAVVYSSAVKTDENIEILTARENAVPIIRRAEMLAEVSRLNYCLAIAGTHGKTTTTSLCGLTLIKAGYDPTVLVGGRLRGLGGTNARLGKGDWTVVEADEYDRSFLQLLPTVAVINNIEAEHLDIYGTEDEVKKAFIEFANKTPFYGFTALGLDDAGARSILGEIGKKIVTFGLSPHADYRAVNIMQSEKNSRIEVFGRGEPLGDITLQVPGLHNVRNLMAAVAVGREIGISFDAIKEAAQEFTGVYLRFEILGEADGILVVDDYAHHPTEVRAALSAARAGWKRRIVAVFQPHTYTRTRDFYREFAQAFDDADILIVSEIYPAREKPIEGISGAMIAETARKFGHRNAHFIAEKAEIEQTLRDVLREGDMLITLGAGDIYSIARGFMSEKYL